MARNGPVKLLRMSCIWKFMAPYARPECYRMQPCLKHIQPMPNVPLAYVSVYQRMSDIFHTQAYASTIRNNVTGSLNVSQSL